MGMKWCTKFEAAQKRCPIVFQGHQSNSKATRDKNRQFWPELNVSGLLIQFEFTDGFEMMHNAWRSTEEVPFCFPRSSTKFQGHAGQKNRQFWPELSVSRLQTQFEFTDGFELMHKAWRSIEKVPYCFSRSSIKLQGHKGWKIDDLKPI